MSRRAPTTKAHAPPPAGHEPAHIHARGVVWLAAAVIGCCVLVVATVFFMTGWLGMPASRYEQRHERVDVRSPEPRLQPDPAADLAEYTRQKRALLHDYHWLDREQGVARIPVGRAMQLLARPAPPASTPPGPARPRR